MAIQDIIKKRRLELGLTLKDVADALGVAESTVSRYETSYIANMKIDKLKALADVLKCTPGYLMGWNEESEFNEDIAGMLIEIKRESDLLKLIELYRSLTNEQKSNILSLLESMSPKERVTDYISKSPLHQVGPSIVYNPSGKRIEPHKIPDGHLSQSHKDNQ